jgi:hypothetical protein
MHLCAGTALALKARLYALHYEGHQTAQTAVAALEKFLRANELDPLMPDADAGLGLYNNSVDTLEEAKADVAGILRTVHFGTAEAHSSAEMMEFNYLSERKAILWEESIVRHIFDFGEMPGAIASLTHELLEMEATDDLERDDAWFAKYGPMPALLREALKNAADVPVGIEPDFSFPTPVGQRKDPGRTAAP